MNKDQFIYWLKGFAKAVNEESPTPKQWETIVSELDQIKDCPDYGSPIGEGGWGTPNNWRDSAPNPFISPLSDPLNPYKITCKENPYTGKSEAKQVYDGFTGSSITNSIITDGFIQNSSITRAQPPFTLTTTSTAYGHVSGSTVNYTVKDKE
jgi:hypothetical protein